MPAAAILMASGYYNGKIYLVGGHPLGIGPDSLSQVWEYDPVANTWNTSRAPIPHPMRYDSASELLTAISM